jgi:hypothetical protein
VIELTKQPVLMELFFNKIGEYEGNEEVDLVDLTKVGSSTLTNTTLEAVNPMMTSYGLST